MKKYIVLLMAFIPIIVLSSCVDRKIRLNEDIRLDVQQCDHNGHKYNVFYGSCVGRPIFSVVHDPDCPKCQKQIIKK